ncbi:hypothetical protein IHZ75_004395 [Salmonella enterica]|nr:hypothetical protein [Salmonella enterica]
MAIQDIVNSSPYGTQYMFGESQYNPTQTNVLGQSLSPTPTAAGMPAVDPIHDSRTPQDVKQQAQQANLDTLSAHDTAGKVVNPSTGFIFNTAPTDRKSQLITGLIAYGTSYLAGQNEGQALANAGQAVNSQIAMNERQKLIPELVQKGYADVDIQKYLETGDTKDLLTNKGKINIVGDRSVNELTGETKDLGMTPQQQADNAISQAKISEDIRHNRVSEGAEGARLGLEQQRINLEKQQYGTLAAQKQEKQNAIQEANNVQIQAVATNAQRATQAGIDLVSNKNIGDYTGASLTHRVNRWSAANFGENEGNELKSQADKYNHQLTTLGNATLYTEAGNKRIFAKEMENSGKQFMPVDIEKDTDEQIKSKVKNNAEIISMYQQWAENSAAGLPHPNANEQEYGKQFAKPVPAYQPAGATPAGGKDFGNLW